MYGILQIEVLNDCIHINRKNNDFNLMILVNILDSFKIIRIPLEREPDVKRFIKHILVSCNLSTENVEKLKIKKTSTSSKFNSDRNSRPDASTYEDYEVYERGINRVKLDKTLK